LLRLTTTATIPITKPTSYTTDDRQRETQKSERLNGNIGIASRHHSRAIMRTPIAHKQQQNRFYLRPTEVVELPILLKA
jgi:hypothetical protein